MFLLYVSFVFILASVCLASANDRIVPIRISSVVVGDNPLFGYAAISAAHDMAKMEAQRRFPRIFRDFQLKTFYQRGDFPTCAQSAGVMLLVLSELYNTSDAYGAADRPTVIMSPGCSTEILQLGDVGREADTPIVASTATDYAFGDDSRFPTVLATGPSAHHAYAQTVLAVVKKFGWTRLSVLDDLFTGSDIFSSLALLFSNVLRSYMLDRGSEIDTAIRNIDSTLTSDFELDLIAVAQHSTVILLVSSPETCVRILTSAVALGMDSGEYVFLIVQFNEIPFYMNTLMIKERELQVNVSTIFPFVFDIITAPRDLSGFEDDWEQIANISINDYNYTIPLGLKFNTIQLSAYESALMAAEVINETYDILMDISARDFISRFRNRTFNLPTGKVTIDEHRMRVTPMVVRMYDTSRKEFEITWSFDSVRLSPVGATVNWSRQWMGKQFPHSSAPVCLMGIYNCVSGVDIDDFSNYSYFAFLIVACAVTALWIAFRLRKDAVTRNSTWWNVRLCDIDYQNIELRHFMIGGKSVDLKISIDGAEMAASMVMYKGKPAQIITFDSDLTFGEVLKHKRMMSILQQIRSLDHPNIADFYGMCFIPPTKRVPRKASILCESPKKGLLREFIDSDNLIFNWDFRASLLWDIVRGLRYIHASPLKFHGVLSFVNLIVDEHFTLKITRTGGLHLFHALNNEELQHRRYPVAVIVNLWMSPEALNLEVEPGAPTPGSPTDIFSLGVLLYEMCTRNAPFDVDLADFSAIHSKIEEVRTGSLDVHAYPVPEDCPPELDQAIRKCWSFDPLNRPTINDISKTLNHLRPHSDVSVAEGILKRMEHYNQELEATVLARKEALHAEMAKVDDLLSNVLPKSIVQKLRNGEEFIPEYFPSVTVMFSDIPAFNDMVAKCAPFSIVDLLHRLYSKMDDVIDQHDVYKVETIKDSYMVASGLPVRNGDAHAMEIAKIALLFLETSCMIPVPTEYGSQNLSLRIGVNSGPCVAAVIGHKQPHYCLVGDTVNTASRMETNGIELKIHITATTKELLDKTGLFAVEERGIITIKGKGDMTTYWLVSMFATQSAVLAV